MILAPLALAIPFLAAIEDRDEEDFNEVFQRSFLLGKPDLFVQAACARCGKERDYESGLICVERIFIQPVVSWICSSSSLDDLVERCGFGLAVIRGLLKVYAPMSGDAHLKKYIVMAGAMYVTQDKTLLASFVGTKTPTFGGPPVRFMYTPFRASDLSPDWLKDGLVVYDFESLEKATSTDDVPSIWTVSWDKDRIFVFIEDEPYVVRRRDLKVVTSS